MRSSSIFLEKFQTFFSFQNPHYEDTSNFGTFSVQNLVQLDCNILHTLKMLKCDDWNFCSNLLQSYSSDVFLDSILRQCARELHAWFFNLKNLESMCTHQSHYKHIHCKLNFEPKFRKIRNASLLPCDWCVPVLYLLCAHAWTAQKSKVRTYVVPAHCCISFYDKNSLLYFPSKLEHQLQMFIKQESPKMTPNFPYYWSFWKFLHHENPKFSKQMSHSLSFLQKFVS